MVTPDFGYLNYMFAVIWLVVYTVGLPVDIFAACNLEGDRAFLVVIVVF
jgi:hypothetical protein